MQGLAPRPGGSKVILGPSPYVPIMSVSCAGNAIRCIVWRDPTSGNVVYWYMPGPTPTYTQTVYSSGPGWTPILAGNFDGDFTSDLLWQHTDGSVAIWLMQGFPAVGFSVDASAVILGPGTGWVPAFLADFDGDGRTDILWRNASTGDTAIWLMDGLSVKPGGAAVILSGALGWTVTNVRDLDGDLKADLIWRSSTGATAAWLMDGVSAKPEGPRSF